MNHIFFCFVILIVGGCFRQSSEKPDFFGFDSGVKLSEVTNDTIKEASGLAASIANPGLLWTLNDSGNDANVFLIDKDLNIVMTVSLAEACNRDWEDIAVGPGPDSTKTYIYVGDIGDNMARHNYKYVYRFEEPVFENAERELRVTKYATLEFRLPYERQDSETLMVDPLSTEIYIIGKREKSVTVYRINQTELNEGTAEVAARLNLTGIVGGAFSPDGREILLKNIYNVYYWERRPGESLKKVLEGKPKVLPYKREPQGEAITFAHDGTGYYTISEIVKGEKSFLQFYRRK